MAYIHVYIYLLKLYYGKIYSWHCLVSRQGNELILFSSQETNYNKKKHFWNLQVEKTFLKADKAKLGSTNLNSLTQGYTMKFI